jgi:hypothetical protein
MIDQKFGVNVIIIRRMVHGLFHHLILLKVEIYIGKSKEHK